MLVRVLLFGLLKDVFGGQALDLDLPPQSTVQAVIDHYRQIEPSRRDLWPSLAVAVNQQHAAPCDVLQEGDEVALLPPVSGGDGARERVPHACAPKIALVHRPIDALAALASVKRDADGAVVVFDGIVRDNTAGRRTLYLHYEAYESMALRSMSDLADEAIARLGARGVAIVHRLGRIEVGETSVLIAVSSAHRAQAFEACKWLIDTLKKTAPIWKKEFFADGSEWARGEPLPARLGRLE